MRKIKDLEVKKSWAKKARAAMFRLHAPAPSWRFSHYDNRRHGNASGCCGALRGGLELVDVFKAFVDPPQSAFANGWWWTKYYKERGSREGYTARIIALESFALYCEEHGV